MQTVLIFLVITYGLSIILALIVGLTDGKDSKLVNLGYAAFFNSCAGRVDNAFCFQRRHP